MRKLTREGCVGGWGLRTPDRWLGKISLVAAAALAFSLGLASSAAAFTDPGTNPPDPTGGVDFTVLGVGGSASLSITSDFKLYQSDTVVDGNVGVGPSTDIAHNMDGTINGTLYVDSTDTCSGCPTKSPPATLATGLASFTGTITGGSTITDMSFVVANARAAASSYAALTPTPGYTFSSLTDGQVINVGHGTTVIDVTGASTIKTTLTINGFADSVVVFQLTAVDTPGHDILTLSGMNMILNGVTADNVIWDATGTGGDITVTSMSAGQEVYGTFLVPDRNFTGDHANIVGEVIAGGSGMLLSIHSGSQIDAPSSVPEPATLFLLGSGLVGVGIWGRKRFSGRAAAD